MAKRRQWMDVLKQGQDCCKDQTDTKRKKSKITIISDVIFRAGKEVQSTGRGNTGTLHETNYYAPELTSFTPTPHHSKKAELSHVKDLTPTFREPKAYLNETKRIVEDICSSQKNLQNNGDNLKQTTEIADFENLDANESVTDFLSTESTETQTHRAEDNSIPISSQSASTSQDYQVSVTIDSILSSPDQLMNLENDTKDVSNASLPQGITTDDIILLGINQTLDNTDTHQIPPKLSSNSLLNSSNVIEPDFEISATPAFSKQSSPVSTDAIIEINNQSQTTQFPIKDMCGIKSAVEQQILNAPFDGINATNDELYHKDNISEIEKNLPDHEIKERKCKKKLNFDKSYLDFIDEDDNFLNEAFPSDASSLSLSEYETSDDSGSEKRNRKKHTKKNKKKKSRKPIAKVNKIQGNKIIEQNSEKEDTEAEKGEHILTPKPKTKRSLNNENKKKRILGQPFTNKKGNDIAAKAMKPNPCGDSCKRKCGEITEERRQELFTYYWNLGSFQRQKDWIAQRAVKTEVTARTTDKGDSSRRTITYRYYINEGHGRRQVCQKFLLNTLDITQRFLLYTVENSAEGFSKIDERKKNGGSNRTNEEVIAHANKFLSSLPLVPSHYCRKDSSRLYLPDEFKNMSNFYRIYAKYCEDEGVKNMSHKVFSNWLNANYNIGIHVPKKDKCMTCSSQTYDVKNKEEMQKFNDHFNEKNESYKRFKCHQILHSVDPSVICSSFDLQKILNTPHGQNMALYYSRKIAVYNLTIYESSTQVGYCNLWTEVDAHRGGNEIATCLFNYIQEVDKRKNIKKLLLYSDSCFGQNKNKTMLSMLRYALSICKNLDIIQMNYLIPGHTFMPVDSMHATIENAIKNTTVWAPSQWPIVIQMARKKPAPYRVSILEGKDFVGFEDILNKSFKKNQKLQISKLRIATFKKSNPDVMFIKTSMMPDTETVEVPLCKLNDPKLKKSLYSAKLPVSLQKYNDLKKLVDKNIIPKSFAQEYINLKHDKKIKDALLETDEEDETFNDTGNVPISK